MGKELLAFDDVKIERVNFHSSKSAIDIDDINIDSKILAQKNFLSVLMATKNEEVT